MNIANLKYVSLFKQPAEVESDCEMSPPCRQKITFILRLKHLEPLDLDVDSFKKGPIQPNLLPLITCRLPAALAACACCSCRFV